MGYSLRTNETGPSCVERARPSPWPGLDDVRSARAVLVGLDLVGSADSTNRKEQGMRRRKDAGDTEAPDTVPMFEDHDLGNRGEGSVWGLLGPLGHRPGREHSTSRHCWCGPTLDYVDQETGAQVWVHRVVH